MDPGASEWFATVGEPMEHRWGCRLRVNHLTRIVDARGVRSIALVRDVSATGAFLETSAPLPGLSRLAVHLSSSASVAQWVDAYAVRRTAEGIGVEWCEFAPPPVALLMASSGPDSLSPPQEAEVPELRQRRSATHRSHRGL
jgi:hypothetical protein